MAKISGSGLFLLVLATLCLDLSAQNYPDIFSRLESKKPGQGTLAITQDTKILSLVNTHLLRQKSMNGIMGYRIAIFSESGQEANKRADQARARFISRHEEVKAYKKFEYPFFKVYVGDFRTKSEALKFLKKIDNEYPDVAFITPPTLISFPD
jgi:hypothetical protein